MRFAAASDFYAKQRQIWAQHAELLSLTASEQAEMMQTLEAVGVEGVKSKPELQ